MEPGNPVGGAFTLPKGWLVYQATLTTFPSTGWTGYLSQSYFDYQNLTAMFSRDQDVYPNAGVTGTVMKTYSFHDRYPQDGYTPGGDPQYTTTHNGNIDFSRNGKIKITPGTNHFGGTMRYLADPVNHHSYQYKSIAVPVVFKGYFTSYCTRMGNPCSTASYQTDVGEVLQSAEGQLYLLEAKNYQYNTQGTPRFGKTKYLPFSYTSNGGKVFSRVQYMVINAPWTTGTATVTNTIGQTSIYGAQVRGVGGDRLPTASEGAQLTLTQTFTDVSYTMGMTYYPTSKFYSTLQGVTRIVSLVKPRLIHAYITPRIETDPTFTNWQANRVWLLDVYFLPEPSAMLLLGSGIVGLAGLAFIRRR